MIRRFRDPWQAALAKSALEASGFEVHLADENMVSQNWLYSHAVGGVSLLVPTDRAGEALEVLGPETTSGHRPSALRATLFGLLAVGPVALAITAAALLSGRRPRTDDGGDGPRR